MSDPIPIDYATPAVQEMDFRKVLLRWEKLRIIYNAVLVAIVLGICLLVHPRILAQINFWVIAISAGVIANIAYCAGPYVDLWLHMWGKARQWSTPVIFLVGLGFSCVVTAIASFIFELPKI